LIEVGLLACPCAGDVTSAQAKTYLVISILISKTPLAIEIEAANFNVVSLLIYPLAVKLIALNSLRSLQLHNLGNYCSQETPTVSCVQVISICAIAASALLFKKQTPMKSYLCYITLPVTPMMIFLQLTVPTCLGFPPVVTVSPRCTKTNRIQLMILKRL